MTRTLRAVSAGFKFWLPFNSMRGIVIIPIRNSRGLLAPCVCKTVGLG